MVSGVITDVKMVNGSLEPVRGFQINFWRQTMFGAQWKCVIWQRRRMIAGDTEKCCWSSRCWVAKAASVLVFTRTWSPNAIWGSHDEDVDVLLGCDTAWTLRQIPIFGVEEVDCVFLRNSCYLPMSPHGVTTQYNIGTQFLVHYMINPIIILL